MEILLAGLGVVASVTLVALGCAWQRERLRRMQVECARVPAAGHSIPVVQAALAARNRELALLNRVITASASDPDLHSIMMVACRELALMIDVPIASALLLTPDGSTCEVVAEYHSGDYASLLGTRFATQMFPYIQCLQQQKRAISIPDVLAESWLELPAEQRALLEKRQSRSLIVVPLTVRDRLIGMIGIDSPLPRVFTETEIALAERVGAALSQMLHIIRLNADLQYSRARLRAAFDTAAVGICVIDLEDRYREVNTQWARLIGRDVASLIDQSHSAYIHSDDRAAYQAALAQLVDHHQSTRSLELRFCPVGGPVFWGALSMACIGDGSGSVVQVIQDVTARRQAEEEREQLIRDLDAFAHSVAHNLKNPLSVVMGFTSMLAEDLKDFQSSSDIPVQQILQSMALSSRHMDEIISTMLFFARVRSTRDITLYPVPIVQTVMSALQRLDFMIAEYEAEIVQPDSTVAGAWPVAWGYQSWIVEVWVNYISNALKYGGVRPRVVLGWDTLSDGMLRFWVRDHGAGIAPRLQERLFKPFQRLVADNGPEGHGLGLAIVQRMVEKLGGQVGVESAVGQGSLFYFTLPSNPILASADQPPASSSSGLEPYDTSLSS